MSGHDASELTQLFLGGLTSMGPQIHGSLTLNCDFPMFGILSPPPNSLPRCTYNTGCTYMYLGPLLTLNYRMSGPNPANFIRVKESPRLKFLGEILRMWHCQIRAHRPPLAWGWYVAPCTIGSSDQPSQKVARLQWLFTPCQIRSMPVRVSRHFQNLTRYPSRPRRRGGKKGKNIES